MSAVLLHVVASTLISAAFAAAAGDHGLLENFSEFVTKFGRKYQRGSKEHGLRQALFHKRVQYIRAHNSRPSEERMWTAKVSPLTDRTDEELAQLRGWRHVKHGHSASRAAFLAQRSEVLKQPPQTVDHRNLMMASDVPDQGGCGSCWAVATASMLQARYELHMNGNRTFSVQQLVNCVPNPRECGGTGGCQGATVELAMQYVQRMGLQEDQALPYAGKGESCQQPMPVTSFIELAASRHSYRGSAAIGLRHWRKLPENRAMPLMQAVANGPVAISVAASDWMYYGTGIFNGCAKDAVVDHAVVLFGYGSEGSNKYWLVRNSWGSSWGEGGYIRLLRQPTAEAEDAYCGTDNDPKAGLACKPYPDSVQVCGMCGLLYDSVEATFAPA